MKNTSLNRIKVRSSIFIFCFCFFLYGFAAAQPKTLDSLKFVLKSKSNIERVNVLNAIAKTSIYGSHKEVIRYAEEALVLAKQLQFKEGEADALYNLSYGYYLKSEIDSSFLFVKHAKKLFTGMNNKNGIAKSFNILGLIYLKKGNTRRSLQNINKAISICDEINDFVEKSKSLNYLGLVYWKLADYANALENFLESLELKEKVSNDNEIVLTLNNISNIYLELKNYNISIKYAGKALTLARELSDNYSIGRALNNLGAAYYELHKYSLALNYLNESLDVKKKANDVKGIGYTLSDIGDCYFAQQNYMNALKYYNRSYDIRKNIKDLFGQASTLIKKGKASLKLELLRSAFDETNRGLIIAKKITASKLIEDAYLNLSEYYEFKNDFKNSLRYYKLFTKEKDKIYTVEANNKIAEVQVKYSTEKKIKENELLKKNNRIKTLSLERQSNIIKFVVVLALLTFLLAFVIYGRFRNKKKANRLLLEKSAEIELANKKLEEKNKQILKQQAKLADTLNELKNEVKERKKYALDLIKAKEKAEAANKLKSEFLAGVSHEIRTPINTVLSYASLLKEELKLEGYSKFASYFNAIENGSNRLIRTIDSILNMSQFQSGEFEVFKDNLDVLEQVVYPLHEEMNTTAENKGIELLIKKLTNETTVWGDQYTLIQLFSNLIDNAIKYTEKGKIEIIISDKDKQYISVVVKDTGIGISPEFIPNIFEPFNQEEMGYSRSFDGNGLGLALVKKYVEVNKGTIEVVSEKGKGTEFIVILPRIKIN